MEKAKKRRGPRLGSGHWRMQVGGRVDVKVPAALGFAGWHFCLTRVAEEICKSRNEIAT